LKSDGTVWAWGYNYDGELGNGGITIGGCYCISTPVLVSDLTGVTAIATRDGYHYLALKSDGTVWAWGLDNQGQLGTTSGGGCHCSTTPIQVSGLTAVTAIAAGEQNSMALKADGTVWDWGNNFYGQWGNGTTTTTGCRCIETTVQVSGLSGVNAIAAGDGRSIALEKDGTDGAWREYASA